MISVIDYGVANLGSMLNMLRKAGVPAEAVSTPEAVARAQRIILPGVGAFDQGMAALAAHGLVEPLRRRASAGIAILGVCLGMQLLSEGSEEGRAAGLGLVAGRCVKFRFDLPRSLKVPHMGWNTVRPVHPNPLVDASEGPRFYFVHSYHVVCERPEEVLATSHYGYDFTSMLNRGNVWGAQFHPEKSHRFGMAMLRRFASL